MRTAAGPASGSRDRLIGREPARVIRRPRLRRAAAALVLGGIVLLLHAWALRDSDRGAAGRRAVAQVPPLQVRSVQIVGAPPPPAAPDRPSDSAPPARARPVPPARTVPIPAPARTPAAVAPMPRVAAVAESPSQRRVQGAAADRPPTVAGEAATESPLPVYATRVPPSARLRYEVRHGAWLAHAIVDWQVSEGAYRLRLQTLSPQGKPIEQLSEGAFDAAGLAPARLADRRRGRGAQAANFEREQARISFSGPRWAFALAPGTQDRLSWMVQLSAIGAGGGVVEGAELALQVVSARGASSRWRFDVERVEALASPLGAVQAWRLVRQPEHLYDLRIEVWLDPQRGWWPVRLRQTQVPGGEPADWWLADEPATTGGT